MLIVDAVGWGRGPVSVHWLNGGGGFDTGLLRGE